MRVLDKNTRMTRVEARDIVKTSLALEAERSGAEMADLDLVEWAAKQADWVQDSLSRISLTAGFVLSDQDRKAVLERIKYAANPEGDAPACIALTSDHLSKCADVGPRATLASIGPLENVDRLAKDQQLRFASAGITLIFGENGSGKSGYDPDRLP